VSGAFTALGPAKPGDKSRDGPRDLISGGEASSGDRQRDSEARWSIDTNARNSCTACSKHRKPCGGWSCRRPSSVEGGVITELTHLGSLVAPGVGVRSQPQAIARAPVSTGEVRLGPDAGENTMARLPVDGSAVVVFEDDQLVGLLDPEHIDALLAVRSAGTRGLA
jgi:hypothetical protein